MTRNLSLTLCLCALVLTGALLFVCFKLSAALDTTRQAAWNISALAYNSAPTVAHVNEATDVWAKASQKQADAADELLRDLRAESWHVDRTLTTFNEQMGHVGPLLDSLRAESDALKETTHAATGTLTAATNTLQTVNDGTKPLLDAYTASGRDLDFLLKSPDLSAALKHANGMTAGGEVILGNAAEVSTKAKNDYMKARTPWGRFATTTLDLIHLGSYAAR